MLKNYLKAKKVLVFDTSDVSANATSASIGMLAPLIETKPYENQLLSLMMDSKKLWDKEFKQRKLANLIGLKKFFITYSQRSRRIRRN